MFWCDEDEVGVATDFDREDRGDMEGVGRTAWS